MSEAVHSPAHSVLDTQVGGSHYKDLRVQPITICEAATKVGGFSLGNIFKYLCRYPFKGKALEDLQKVQHYIQLQAFSYVPLHQASADDLHLLSSLVWEFIIENETNSEQTDLLIYALNCVYLRKFDLLENALADSIREMEYIIQQQEKQNG